MLVMLVGMLFWLALALGLAGAVEAAVEGGTRSNASQPDVRQFRRVWNCFFAHVRSLPLPSPLLSHYRCPWQVGQYTKAVPRTGPDKEDCAGVVNWPQAVANVADSLNVRLGPGPALTSRLTSRPSINVGKGSLLQMAKREVAVAALQKEG